MSQLNESTIPVSGSLVAEILKGFTSKPYRGDDSWEDCSIGVAKNSIVATDSYSAILVGEDAEEHYATLRKEVVIECTRANEYGDPVEIDNIPKNIDQSTGAAKVMPNARGVINSRLADMQSIATVSPEALQAIGRVAAKSGASSVELLQPKTDDGMNTSVGFKFTFYPDQEHVNLFSSWEGPISVRGVFKATRMDASEAVDDEPETSVQIVAEEAAPTPEPKRRKAKAAPVPVIAAEPDEPTQPEPVPAPDPVDETIELERGDYRLPALQALSPQPSDPPESGQYGQAIINQLRAFNLQGRLIATKIGPRITQYEFQVPPGVKVSRYTNLAADIQMQLAVKSVAIEPIIGQNALGIQVPNRQPRPVCLRGVCARREFLDAKAPLTFALGEDVSGAPVYADLAKMPHLLIGGATNSGKSIGVAALITSLLMRNTPKDLRFVMIDPKRVELTLFDGIPHLMCPVIKDVKEAPGVLRAVWREMDRRYDLLSNEGCRNIDGWNAKASFQDKLPYIVVIIDELADLMIQAGPEVETTIVRLAQMARAVGIHLVIATQRPSVDVITGLIKANIPSRVAFNVASLIDSRVILDTAGAEKLLGEGDMLFNPIDASRPLRLQGAFVSEADVEAICKFWRGQSSPCYEIDLNEDPQGSDPDDNDPDPLYDEAVELVIERRAASTSILQRRFSIGFQRAARLIDAMEAASVIGPGPGPRRILVAMGEKL